MKNSWNNLRKFSGITLLISGSFLGLSSSCGVFSDSSDQSIPSLPPATAQSTASWTTAEMNYFQDIAFGAEYGDSNANVVKWVQDLRIKVIGRPSPQDQATLNQVIQEINGLVQGIKIRLDNQNPNIELYFVPESEFSRYESNYVPVNYGFFWYWWNRNHEIIRAKILISTEKITQQERDHLLREELTQSLGLAQDSYQYPDSIFYQGWTKTTAYSRIDQAVIRMLYQPQIRPGMTAEEAIRVLQQSRK